MYFNCKTNLVPTFRRMFPGKLHCEGNRALVFAARARVPTKELRRCIALALTYHRTGKGGATR
jgi:hypothetical protein